MLDLDPNGFATYAEVEAHLRRGVSQEDGDPERITDAYNRAAGWMEWRTRRRLRSRVHRKPVTIASCGTTADDQAVSGSGFSALVVGDDVVGSGVAVGSRIQSVGGNTSLALTRKATATGTVSLTFGSAALLRHGDGTNEIYAGEHPLTSLIGAYTVEDDGTRTALDITGARIETETGLIVLPADSFPEGRLNISIDCVAGYVEPSATSIGDWGAWSALKGIHLRVAEVFFLDAASLRGRQTSMAIGQSSSNVNDFNMPADIEGAIRPFVRGWA